MSQYLLDTNAVLIGLTEPSLLKPSVRSAMRKGENILSTIVYWEVVLKSMKKKLDVGDPRSWWDEALDQLAATPLPVRPDHISALCSLPPIHHDPFDRLLIAQAIAEDFTLITLDQEAHKYTAHGLKILK